MAATENASPAFYHLLSLATMGATGKNVAITNVDWPAVVRLAQEQVVLPLIGITLVNNEGVNCPEDIRCKLIDVARSQSSINLVRKQRIVSMLHEMEQTQLYPLLIKGYPVGDCYAYPESRGSNDTDILIFPEQEDAVCEFLRNKGFRVDQRGKTSHHAIAQHPKFGMVEVHIQLYAELMQEVWFQVCKRDVQIKEETVQVETGAMCYSSLGHTDHLIFLTLHTIKHFIISGMGVRMMLDMAMYFSRHKDEIDVARYWRVMKELKYTEFVNCVLWSIVDTGCIDSAEFPGIGPKCPAKIQKLLYDLESSGHMGIKEAWPEGSYEYNRRILMQQKSLGQYRVYMLKMKIRDAYHQMFPNKEELCRIYPVIENCRWLTVFARIHRMFAYPVQKIASGELRKQLRSSSTDMPEEAKRRVELFKALGMM